MKRLVLLGSTGSIGENTLRVVDSLPAAFQVVGLAANRNWKRVLEQAIRYRVPLIALADEEATRLAREAAPPSIKVLGGQEGICELAANSEADVVVMALVGMAGLRPSLAAIDAGHDLALATKEVLVAAGEIVMRRRAQTGTRILPVDSEHSAIFQAMQSTRWCAACVQTGYLPCAEDYLESLTLTASGGPFFDRHDIDFSKVTLQQAMAHPTWAMGRKVTIDSATMMNKGLELIEAHWLFNMPPERLHAIVHPESIVHSLITYRDGTSLAQLSPPDMRYPIQYALTYPERRSVPMPRLDLAQVSGLHFCRPDENRFPSLALARTAMCLGGMAPTVLNAANEVAVERFIKGEISFAHIAQLVERALSRHTVSRLPSLDEILSVDTEVRAQVAAY